MNTETQPFTVTPEQRRQLRKDLVAALRSGEFKQGKGRLCRGGKFCCLGICCVLFDRAFAGVLKISTAADCTTYDERLGVLPDIVKDAFGFQHINGAFRDGCLACHNDRGVPFPAIADLIESNPPGLWVDEVEVANA